MDTARLASDLKFGWSDQLHELGCGLEGKNVMRVEREEGLGWWKSPCWCLWAVKLAGRGGPVAKGDAEAYSKTLSALDTGRVARVGSFGVFTRTFSSME